SRTGRRVFDDAKFGGIHARTQVGSRQYGIETEYKELLTHCASEVLCEERAIDLGTCQHLPIAHGHEEQGHTARRYLRLTATGEEVGFINDKNCRECGFIDRRWHVGWGNGGGQSRGIENTV